MSRSLAFVVGFLAASTAMAQDHAHAPERLGVVSFPTSCKPAVEREFNRAVAWLHSFEFASAIQGFEKVLATDSSCAMADWGIAMSWWGNPMSAANRPTPQLQRGLAAAESARMKAAGSATPRENAFIAAVSELYRDFRTTSQRARVAAYEQAMARVAREHPGDSEAKIFHAIALVAAAPTTDKTYASQRRAGAILEQLWALQPEHPGLAHYIIHTYDYPALATAASRAAQTYASIAPSAAHALHMPSHVFTRTGAWRESIETNRRSYDIAIRTGSIAEALHALDYMVYAYLQLGRDTEAKSVLDRLPQIAKQFDPNAVTGAAPGSAGVFALAAMPARYALERGAWSEAAALKPAPSNFPWTEAMTFFARALGAARIGDTAIARPAVDSLDAIPARLTARDEPYWAEQVAIQALAGRAWLDLARGNADSALSQMRQAVAREAATEKSAVTPGPLAPATELLADMLVELGRREEAATQYRKTLEKEPNRRRAIAGLAAVAGAGK